VEDRLAQHSAAGLASSLTALSMALGVALVVCVLVVYGVVSNSFAKGPKAST